MEVDSITFDYINDVIIVTFTDGSTREYTESDKDQYLQDFLDRESDVKAMGW